MQYNMVFGLIALLFLLGCTVETTAVDRPLEKGSFGPYCEGNVLVAGDVRVDCGQASSNCSCFADQYGRVGCFSLEPRGADCKPA